MTVNDARSRSASSIVPPNKNFIANGEASARAEQSSVAAYDDRLGHLRYRFGRTHRPDGDVHPARDAHTAADVGNHALQEARQRHARDFIEIGELDSGCRPHRVNDLGRCSEMNYLSGCAYRMAGWQIEAQSEWCSERQWLCLRLQQHSARAHVERVCERCHVPKADLDRKRERDSRIPTGGLPDILKARFEPQNHKGNMMLSIRNSCPGKARSCSSVVTNSGY